MSDTQFAGFRLYGITGSLLMLVGLGLFLSYAVKLLFGTPGIPDVGEVGMYFAATGGAMVVAIGYALRRTRHDVTAAKALAVPVGTGFALWATMRLLAAAFSPEMAASAGPLLYVEVVFFSTASAVFFLSALNEKKAFRIHFMNLNRGVMATHNYVMVWLMMLTLSNGMVPLGLIIWEATSPGATGLTGTGAQIMFTAFLIGPVIGAALYPFTGMSRLMGLMHVPWMVAALVLYQYLQTDTGWRTAETWFDYWAYAGFATAATSLVVDILDVVRFMVGDRKHQWEVPSAI